MSSPWTALPQELVRKVFSELAATRDILKLQCICKAWRSAAQEKLYTSIRITLTGARREQRLVQALFTPGSKARYYVKSLFILTFGNDENLNLIPARILYQTIHQLREAQHLQKLQWITTPWPGAYLDDNHDGNFDDYLNDYGELMLLLKNSATQFTIYSNTNTAITEHDSIIEAFPLAKQLKMFVCMEQILIRTSVYLTLTQLGELLDMCPSTKVRVVELSSHYVQTGHQGRLLSTVSQEVNTVHPQRALTSVKELKLEQRALPTDQDLQWIMEKFPALHRLVARLVVRLDIYRYGNDIVANAHERRIVYSADTAIAFVKYLWRIPHSDFEGFKTTPETMSKIISRISQCNQANSLSLASTYKDERELPTLTATRNTPDKGEATKSIELRIPLHLESLFQYALQAFSSHTNFALRLRGSVISDMNNERAVDLPLNDRTQLESKTLVSSLEYAINNYSGLKTLALCNAVFPPTYFDTAFKKRLQLDELSIRGCSMNAETWDILSKRLEHVTSFKVELRGWDYKNPFDEEDLYMPHTTFGDIYLYEYHGEFVKICTNAATVYVDLYGIEPDKLLLTEQQYNDIQLESDFPYEYCQKITCKEWSSVSNKYVTIHNN
ncbi:hypothetical protein MBANPS3_010076 [Mucor bainieri]